MINETLKQTLQETLSKIGGQKSAAYETLKRRYREQDAVPANLQLDKDTSALIAQKTAEHEALLRDIRAENDAKKAENISQADRRAKEDVEYEFGATEAQIKKMLGGDLA